jgi:hypothetical protein
MLKTTQGFWQDANPNGQKLEDCYRTKSTNETEIIFHLMIYRRNPIMV